MNNTIILELQIACTKTVNLPDKPFFIRCLNGIKPLIYNNKVEITIRIVDEYEIHKLNMVYRNINKPTNVLSFPYQLPYEVNSFLLGDIIICKQTVEHEALTLMVSLESHWAHMIIHGTLHLLGYDHASDETAMQMETLEVNILNQLGYSNPYILY